MAKTFRDAGRGGGGSAKRDAALFSRKISQSGKRGGGLPLLWLGRTFKDCSELPQRH